MNYLYKSLLGICTLFFLFSCTAKPVDIEYGVDECAFCDMTIMDNKFSAELVTTKGKVFKFDAIECMLRYDYRNPNKEYAFKLVADYLNPGEFADAAKSTFLISKNLPSPMGANLSAFFSMDEAKQILDSKGGLLYSYDEIIKHIK